MRQVSVQRLFDDRRERLGLAWVAGRQGGSRELTGEASQQPTIGLIGHLNFIHPFRIQIMGAASSTTCARCRAPSSTARSTACSPRNWSPSSSPMREAVPDLLLAQCECAPRGAVHSSQPSPHLVDVLRLYLPRELAEIDDAARRVARRARDGRADHRRIGDRQERARARAHLARQRPRRRRRRRAVPDRPGDDRRRAARRAARFPRGARPRRAQHPHDLRRDRGAPAQGAEADRAPRGSQQRGVTASTGCRSTPPTRRSSAWRSAR